MRKRETRGTCLRGLVAWLTGTLFVVTLLFAVACEPAGDEEQDGDAKLEEVSPEYWEDVPDIWVNPETSDSFDTLDWTQGIEELSGLPFTGVVFDPTGHYALHQTTLDEALCLEVMNLDTGNVVRHAEACNLRAIAVSSDLRAYLLSEAGNSVSVLELAEGTNVSTAGFSDEYQVLDLSPDGATLVLSNRPVAGWELAQYEWRVNDLGLCHLGVLQVATLAVHEQTFPNAIRSIAFSPLDGSVLVGTGRWEETGLPESRVHWFNPTTGLVENEVTFPNCPAPLQVQAGAKHLVMSPNVCFLHPVETAPPVLPDEPQDDWDVWGAQGDGWGMDSWEDDPTSIVNLETREYVGKLPGFGPLAISPDGSTVVGFSRRDALMKQWNMFQQTQFGVVSIRLDDLYWKFVNHGDTEPRFLFGSDSNQLLIQDTDGGASRLLGFRLDTEQEELFEGPAASLEGASFSALKEVLYLLDEGAVIRADVSGKTSQTWATSFAPSQLFVRPQGDAVLAVDAADSDVHFINPTTGTEVRALVW